MIVTISRQLGSGGLFIGKAIAEVIGAEFLDERTLVNRSAKRLAMPEEYLESIDERPKTISESLLSDLARASGIIVPVKVNAPDAELFDTVREIVAEASQHGHVVVIGHGGPSLVAPFSKKCPTFHILVHANFAWRVARISERFHLNSDDAKKRILQTDPARERYVAAHARTNMYDAHEYDLTIDTGHIGIEVAAAIAVEAVRAALG